MVLDIRGGHNRCVVGVGENPPSAQRDDGDAVALGIRRAAAGLKPAICHTGPVDHSGSARLLAAHRVRESERADAVFRDPFASALGAVDAALARVVTGGDATDWLFTARTHALIA
jgi:hypothetical protein